MPKLKLTKILKRIQDSGALHFSPEQGAAGFEKMTQRQALKALRDAGIEAVPTAGMYKGIKEGSILIPEPNERARKIVSEMAKKTGQESVLEASPNFESKFNYITGEKAGSSEALGTGVKISDTQPAHDYWTKFNTETGPKYLDYGSGTVPKNHFGPPGLTEIDVGKVATAGDRPKFAKTGPPETKFQSAYELGTEPEALIQGRTKYVVNMPTNTYDFAKDSEGFLDKAQKMMVDGQGGQAVNATDLAKRLAKEAGYEGITWNMPGKGKITETFKNVAASKGAMAALTAGAVGAATLGGNSEAEASGKSDIAKKISSKIAAKSANAEFEAAQALLAKINTPEIATKLQGAEKKAYLEALDLVHGDRAKRAKDLGFGEETYYHGSFRDIKEFKPEKGSPEGFLGKSTYLTNDPADASKHYASPSGPDVKNNIDRLADRYESEYGMKPDEAKKEAYKKIVGRVDSGAVYPLKVRTENTADLTKQSKQYVDLNNKYDDAGELLEENSTLNKLHEIVNPRTQNPHNPRGQNDFDLYDDAKPREIVDKIKRATRYADDDKGNLIGSELARQGLEASGFDSAIANANEEFGHMKSFELSPESKHLMVFDPTKIRSTNAAFDPRFKNSANILAGKLAMPTGDQTSLDKWAAENNPELAESLKPKSRFDKLTAQALAPMQGDMDLTFLDKADEAIGRTGVAQSFAQKIAQTIPAVMGSLTNQGKLQSQLNVDYPANEVSQAVGNVAAEIAVPSAYDLMGGGLPGAGSIQKFNGQRLDKVKQQIAEKAAAKLESAIAQGYKPTAAEGLAYSKFKNQVPVIPATGETKNVADLFHKPAAAIVPEKLP